jgi:hypothetical protein
MRHPNTAVVLEIYGTEYELDLAGSDSRKVLAQTRNLVAAAQDPQSPAAFEFLVRPAHGDRPSELVYVPAEVLGRSHVYLRVDHDVAAAAS